MAKLHTPDQVYNWIRDFFSGHSHCTKLGSEVSSFLDVTVSIIQGSGLGPASYTVSAADLRPRHAKNAILKYADDTYLICAYYTIHVMIKSRMSRLGQPRTTYS